MPRPSWSGTIQISLVGFAVEIYPATNTTKPFAFHEVDRNTLTRVRRQSISPGPAPDADTAGETEEHEETVSNRKTALHLALPPEDRFAGVEPKEHFVERANIVKGYEYAPGKYAVVEPDELKNLRLAGKKTVEISQFAKVSEIDPALYERPYFVMPKAGPQAVAFAVVKQGLEESGMVGVGEIVFSGRQHLMILGPPHSSNQPGMMLYTLRFASELRDAHEYSTNVDAPKADAAQLKLARQLIEAYAQPFELSSFRDHYEDALRQLVEAKMQNLPAPEPEVEKKPPQVVDLMEALRKSLLQKNPSQAADSSKDKPKAGRSSEGKTGSGSRGKAKAGRSLADGKKAKSA